eukprot:CAMPEP_0119486118 /NCGR_PEP_ID=MMETSP1344-20130328/12610_1 /TAXON_ID=236787 /ORGANISM="Florenciella parvula, Strain CCMP2471" /LENGTH=114 /DNA_ID=CAMNT_0007520837 /DNA_START=52 /DNA_END=393 /DNA_ORIENTATION=+
MVVHIQMNIHLNMDLCIFTLEYADHYRADPRTNSGAAPAAIAELLRGDAMIAWRLASAVRRSPHAVRAFGSARGRPMESLSEESLLPAATPKLPKRKLGIGIKQSQHYTTAAGP